MTQFARDFVSSIEGTNVDISTKELSGGARVYYIFNDIFGHALASIDSTQNLDNQDIRTAIRNSTGPRPSLFVPEIAFDLLVKPQIKLLEAPSLRCVELVYEELVKICHNCTSNVSVSYLCILTHLLTSLTNAGIITISPTTCAARRGCFGTSQREARSHIRICSKLDRDSGCIHQYESPCIHVRVSSSLSKRDCTKKPPTFTCMLCSVLFPFFNLIHVHYQPTSSGSTNGPMPDDDDDSSAEDTGHANGVLHNERSVSSTVHDRSRTTSSSTPTGTVVKQSSRHQHSQQSHRHSIGHPQPMESTKTSPQNARETFLNYFFGQNGPGPIAGSSMERPHGQNVPIGRDMSGGQTSMSSGLMAGKRSLDGNNAAFDMKSLGKHIEAVSHRVFHGVVARLTLRIFRDSFGRWFPINDTGRNGNLPYPLVDRLVLFDRPPKHSGI